MRIVLRLLLTVALLPLSIRLDDPGVARSAPVPEIIAEAARSLPSATERVASEILPVSGAEPASVDLPDLLAPTEAPGEGEPTLHAARPALPADQAPNPISRVVPPTGKALAIASAVRPTISVSPSSGYAGQSVAVTGQVGGSYSGVRVVWWTGNTTRLATVASRDTSGGYSATLTVPADAKAGAAKVCAAVTGTAQAEFACAAFTIQSTPPANVEGTLGTGVVSSAEVGAAAALSSASLVLYDTKGTAVYTTSINADGSYSISGVAAGTYKTAVTGQVSNLVKTGTVSVSSSGVSKMSVTNLSSGSTYTDPVTGDSCNTSRLSNQSAYVSSVTAEKNGPPASGKDFGTYVRLGETGSAVPVKFHAEVQEKSGTSAEKVSFHIQKPSGDVELVETMTSKPWKATLNVSTLSAGTTNLIVAPTVNGERQCPTIMTIEVISDPMNDSLVKDGQTVFGSDNDVYVMSGTLPKSTLLPLEKDFNVPVIGTLENEIDAGLPFKFVFSMDGSLKLEYVKAEGLVRVLDVDIYDRTKTLIEDYDSIKVNSSDVTKTSVDWGPYTLWEDEYELPPIPLWSTSFIVGSVTLSLGMGLEGDLTIKGTIQPLLPAFDATLTASATPRIALDLTAELLGGAMVASATPSVAGTVSVPVTFDSDASTLVKFGSVCFTVDFDLDLIVYSEKLFSDEIGTVWYQDTFDIFEYSSCPSGITVLSTPSAITATPGITATRPITPPRLLSAPTLAPGPGGQMLSVYVDDATPGDAKPSPQVMARFWLTPTKQWGSPMALSNGLSTVNNPVAAFVGRDGHAIVAWTESGITVTERASFDRTRLLEALARQEVATSYWDGSKWTYRRLTTDSVLDGRPAIAGDDTGATLAWVRDTDGDVRTFSDLRVAIAQWNDANRSWSPPEMLNATRLLTTTGITTTIPITGAAHGHVAVDRAAGQRVLAFTVDADGNPGTAQDRILAIADWNPISSTWMLTTTLGVPPGANAPSVAIDPRTRGLLLAFTMGGKDRRGNTISGIGTDFYLWYAQRDAGGQWRAGEIADGREHIRAERPQIRVTPAGEAIILLRRFGKIGTNAQLGQLAILRRPAGRATFSRPMYLTNEGFQNWQPSFAINPDNGQVVINAVRRPPPPPRTPSATTRPVVLASATSSANPAAHVQTLATSGADSLQSLVIEAGADPSLDSTLAVSPQHAAVGSTVVVTATVRNVGSAPAGGLSVKFSSGTVTGTVLSTVALTDTIEFNDTVDVPVQITRASGLQQITAQVGTTGGDLSGGNNQATVNLGDLPVPTSVGVMPSSRYSSTLDVTWQPLTTTAEVAGYRILRSESVTGTYELVGQTTVTAATFSDEQLQGSKTYFYVVQAYDDAGTWSANSSPPISRTVAAATGTTAYLPLVMTSFVATVGW